MPENTAYVGRPTKWGNPHSGSTPESVRERYLEGLRRGELGFTMGDVHRELGGRNLSCWCPKYQPCHADVLPSIADAGPRLKDSAATGWE